jgi:hypothetical protein
MVSAMTPGATKNMPTICTVRQAIMNQLAKFSCSRGFISGDSANGWSASKPFT